MILFNITFLKQVRQEWGRVVWPPLKQVLHSLLLILVVVSVVGLFVLFLDYVFFNLVHFVLDIGK